MTAAPESSLPPETYFYETAHLRSSTSVTFMAGCLLGGSKFAAHYRTIGDRSGTYQ